ncbi:Transcription elongation factor B polypeptide 3 [Halotydeus destructor]|nr:Transcription elongation factor B polypeptide 3 [Halotydeus destructor]
MDSKRKELHKSSKSSSKSSSSHRKSNSSSSSSSSKHGSTSGSVKVKKEKGHFDALVSPAKLVPLSELDILGDLDDIGDEKPSISGYHRSSTGSRKDNTRSSEAEAVPLDPLLGFTSRKGRTAVYAGSSRHSTVPEVYRLEDLCLRVLMDHVDKITYLGDAPYYLMKSVLTKCTPAQLTRIEEYNDHLLDETEELWEDHCRAQFKDQFPEEDDGETWRDLFARAMRDRERKLTKLTNSIRKTTEAKAAPVRKTVKMDSFAAGRMKNGRAQYSVTTDSNSNGRIASAFVKDNIHKARMATQSKDFKKPGGKAPLMAKTLQMMKNRFRK